MNTQINRPDDFSFWSEAVDFAKSVLTDRLLHERFMEYAEEKKLNHPEMLLFRKLVSDAFDLEMLTGQLKLQGQKSKEV